MTLSLGTQADHLQANLNAQNGTHSADKEDHKKILEAFIKVKNDALEDVARSLDGIVADWPDKACEDGSFLIEQIRAAKVRTGEIV
jgi:hypothetical protein